MARTPKPTDFQVTVEGIGTFTFMRRRMREEMAISAEYSRLTEGVEVPTVWLDNVAGWISQLGVLTVHAPAGWTLDLDELDPEDQDTYERLVKVHRALREKEKSFRTGRAAASETSGEATQ